MLSLKFGHLGQAEPVVQPATQRSKDLKVAGFVLGKREEEKGGENSEAHTYGSCGSPGYGSADGCYGCSGVCGCQEEGGLLPTWPKWF